MSIIKTLKTLALAISLFNVLWLPVHGEKKAKRGSNVRGYTMEVVNIPESVSASFCTLKKQAVLCHPTKSKAKQFPLVISLHGAGGGAAPIESRMRASIIKELSKTENQKFNAKILVPQSDRVWEPASLSKMLDYILSQNPDIDPDRIYCVGYSMGGKGTWEWAMLEPDRFAAISPKGFIPDYSRAEQMLNLPIWAMVGTKDTQERVEGISKMKDEFEKVGSSSLVKLSIFEGANHKTASAEAKAVQGIYEWLFSHKK